MFSTFLFFALPKTRMYPRHPRHPILITCEKVMTIWSSWSTGKSYCALCPGVVDWHSCGTILGELECGWGFFLVRLHSPCTLSMVMGASLMLLYNGPTPWQCSQRYLVRFTMIMQSFLWGFLFADSFSAQNIGQCYTVGQVHNINFRT